MKDSVKVPVGIYGLSSPLHVGGSGVSVSFIESNVSIFIINDLTMNIHLCILIHRAQTLTSFFVIEYTHAHIHLVY